MYSKAFHFFKFTNRQQWSHILKSSSDYCCCQETLSLFFSDRYCRGDEGEEKKKKNQHYNFVNIFNTG